MANADRHPLRRGALTLAFAALAACAAQRTPPPPPPPPQAAPAAMPAQPAIRAIDPNTVEPSRTRIKQTLAKSRSDSLAPADVGYYLDVLQGRLQQQGGADIAIARRIDRLVLDLTRRVGFAERRAQIDAAECKSLAPLSHALVEYRMTLVSVQVSAADSGAPARRLAEQRAQALSRCLTESGVASRRIVVVAADPVQPSAVPAESEPRVHVEMQLEPIVRAEGDGSR